VKAADATGREAWLAMVAPQTPEYRTGAIFCTVAGACDLAGAAEQQFLGAHADSICAAAWGAPVSCVQHAAIAICAWFCVKHRTSATAGCMHRADAIRNATSWNHRFIDL